MATAYDVIEAIEGDGIALCVAHSQRNGWRIKTDGRKLTDQHRMLIGAFRADIVSLLGKRQLAASRMETAKELGLCTEAVRMSYAYRYMGDELRAFDAGWPASKCIPIVATGDSMRGNK